MFVCGAILHWRRIRSWSREEDERGRTETTSKKSGDELSGGGRGHRRDRGDGRRLRREIFSSAEKGGKE